MLSIRSSFNSTNHRNEMQLIPRILISVFLDLSLVSFPLFNVHHFSPKKTQQNHSSFTFVICFALFSIICSRFSCFTSKWAKFRTFKSEVKNISRLPPRLSQRFTKTNSTTELKRNITTGFEYFDSVKKKKIVFLLIAFRFV